MISLEIGHYRNGVPARSSNELLTGRQTVATQIGAAVMRRSEPTVAAMSWLWT